MNPKVVKAIPIIITIVIIGVVTFVFFHDEIISFFDTFTNVNNEFSISMEANLPS